MLVLVIVLVIVLDSRPRLRLFCDGPEFALLLNEFRDQTGPAGLMRRAEAGAGVAVKIFVE